MTHSERAEGFIHSLKTLGRIGFMVLRGASRLDDVCPLKKIVVRDLNLIKQVKELKEEAYVVVDLIKTQQYELQRVVRYESPGKTTPVLLSKNLDFNKIDPQNFQNFVLKRSPTFHEVQKIRSLIVKHTFDFFVGRGSFLVDAPKLLPFASESGAAVYRVSDEYSGKVLSLAQSPQLYKQYMVNSGLQSVFEYGPIFRAQNSNTPRHMCEALCVDFECLLKEGQDEKYLMKVLKEYLIYVTKELHKTDPLLKAYTEDDFGYVTHEEVLNHFKVPQITIREEKQIPEMVGKPLVFVTCFPNHLRPFYTKENTGFDLVCDFSELCSGAVRVSDFKQVRRKVPEDLRESFYENSFEYGNVPHGGWGFGLDRFLTHYLNYTNVRDSKFHCFV